MSERRSLVTLMLAATALPAWCAHPCAACHAKEVVGYDAIAMAIRSLHQNRSLRAALCILCRTPASQSDQRETE